MTTKKAKQHQKLLRGSLPKIELDRPKLSRLCVSRCPEHDYFMVGIDFPDGTGLRLTPSKCCGRWDTVISWPLTKDKWKEISEWAEHCTR